MKPSQDPHESIDNTNDVSVDSVLDSVWLNCFISNMLGEGVFELLKERYRADVVALACDWFCEEKGYKFRNAPVDRSLMACLLLVAASKALCTLDEFRDISPDSPISRSAIS